MTPPYFTEKVKINYRWLYDCYVDRESIINMRFIHLYPFSGMVSGKSIEQMGFSASDHPEINIWHSIIRLDEVRYDFMYDYIIQNEHLIMLRLL